MSRKVESAIVESGLMRITDILKLIPVSRSTLYSWMNTGRFPESVKNGNTAFWRKLDVADWLANPSNVKYLPKPDIGRLAKNSKIFATDLERFTKVSESSERVMLAALLFWVSERDTSLNAYDRKCLERVRQRISDLDAGARPALDLAGMWIPT